MSILGSILGMLSGYWVVILCSMLDHNNIFCATILYVYIGSIFGFFAGILVGKKYGDYLWRLYGKKKYKVTH